MGTTSPSPERTARSSDRGGSSTRGPGRTRRPPRWSSPWSWSRRVRAARASWSPTRRSWTARWDATRAAGEKAWRASIASWSQRKGDEVPHAEHSVVIKRPVSEVFAYVIDGTKGPSWRPSVADIKLVAGAAGQVGARYEQGMKGGPGGRIPADY